MERAVHQYNKLIDITSIVLDKTQKPENSEKLRVIRSFLFFFCHISEDEWVVTIFSVTGTFMDEWFGMKPTRKPITYAGLNVDRIRGGNLDGYISKPNETMMRSDNESRQHYFMSATQEKS